MQKKILSDRYEFFSVPKIILKRRDLDYAAKFVYLYLYSLWNPQPDSSKEKILHPRIETINNQTGIPIRTIKWSLKLLKEKDLIDWKRGRRGNSFILFDLV